MDINLLTHSQQEVYKKFINFMLSDESNLIIQGAAGTGKSFLTKYLIEDGIQNYIKTCKATGLPVKYKDYEVCATTNKAVESLTDEITLPIGKEVTTLASLLHLHLTYDSNKHKQVLAPNGKNYVIISGKIIFIDECSMISEDIFDYINMLLQNCKIIFIGDKFQLPPVKEKQSAIYDCKYSEVTLNEPVRNAGNQDLVNLCQQLKDTCETGIWKDIKAVPGSIEVIKDGKEMQNLFNQIFLNPTHDKKILAYSNRTVSDYAQCIMELRGQTDYLAEGTWYTSNNYYREPSSFGKIERLQTDSPVKVLEVHDNVDEHIYTKVYGISNKDLINKRILKEVILYSPKLDKSWSDYVFSDPEYYRQYMKWLAKHNYDVYIKYKDYILDLRRSESSTVHKAQGQTLDTVLIDLYDISTCTQKDLTAKLLYVAASRAKNKIIFYGELAKRYGITVG